MQRRDVLGAGGIVLTTMLAGCVTSAFDDGGRGSDPPADAETAPQSDGGPANVIEVRTDGIVEAEPDRATLSVGVEARADSAEAVTETLAERAADLRATFDEFQIPDENVETDRYDVGQPRNGGGYEGSHRFAVTLDDIERVGEVIDAATAAGADDVGRVRFGLSDETRVELRMQALDEALANADAEAQHVAANRGVTLTGTRSVSTLNVDVVPVEATTREMEAADDAAAPPTDVDAGPVTVSASALVTYGFADSG